MNIQNKCLDLQSASIFISYCLLRILEFNYMFKVKKKNNNNKTKQLCRETIIHIFRLTILHVQNVPCSE